MGRTTCLMELAAVGRCRLVMAESNLVKTMDSIDFSKTPARGDNTKPNNKCGLRIREQKLEKPTTDSVPYFRRAMRNTLPRAGRHEINFGTAYFKTTIFDMRQSSLPPRQQNT